MLEKLAGVEQRFHEALNAVESLEQLEELRVKFCGKKGELTELLRSMGSLSPEDRPKMGQKVNELRTVIEEAIPTVTPRNNMSTIVSNITTLVAIMDITLQR